MRNERRLVDRREVLAGGAAVLADALLSAKGRGQAAPTAGRRRSLRPGEIWNDTSGKPIQAHGGSILTVGNQFYWYGENKEFTTGKAGDPLSWGVRCYRSTDLYNWDDLGLIIPPNEHDPASPFHPSSDVSRPHIFYEPVSKKFVCWVKIQGAMQTRTVSVADTIEGPYRLLRLVLPLGMSAGDFDIAVSPDDHKAYMYFERVHTEMICADLTPDGTDFTGYYSTHFPHAGPPLTREAPAHFFRNAKHYLATSGTTGYFPNPTEIAVADTFHGPFTVLGDLCRKDVSETSFNSQICSVFKHPGKKDLYIALADRWMGPQEGEAFESGKMSRVMRAAFAKHFARPPQPLSADEAEALALLRSHPLNTSRSRYVWLPLRFEGDRPYLDWRKEWTVEEFE